MKIFSYQFNVAWIFFIIIAFCIYILFGLYVTEKLDSFIEKILGWVIYTLLWITFLNVFILSYFWSVVQNKTGPPGLRGPEGETGGVGIKGKCSITASQAYCMQQLNFYIDNLYKGKTNTDILNSDTQKFPCTYLNEKIEKIAGSRQYQVIVGNLSNENKGIDNIVNYLKSIWKEWFELIFNATSVPGAWFNDEFGDEQYNWAGNNPFDEIKKYDVYYWGITRDFRPLKAEICRSTINNNNDKFPQPQLSKTTDNYDEPRLKIMETNYYKYGSNDWKTGGSTDASWWRPRPVVREGSTYYPVGDIVINTNGISDDRNMFYWPAPENASPEDYINSRVKTGNLIIGEIQHPDPRDFTLETNDKYFQGYSYENNSSKLAQDQASMYQTGTGPDLTTVLVAGDVVDPIGYEPVKNIDDGGRFWNNNIRLKCPEGYTSMGDFMVSSKLDMHRNAIINDKVKCVPTECLEPLVSPSFSGGNWGESNFITKLKHIMDQIKSGARSPNPQWEWSDNYGIYDLKNPNNSQNERASYLNGYNLFRVGPDISEPFYKIKKSCLEKTPKTEFTEVPEQPPPSTKEVEQENADLGIGWYGHPYKLDPKYSIFSFLNLVPEGMIVHRGTGQRFYIVHVEGDDINLFNILTYNINTNNYDGSLRAIDYNHNSPAQPESIKYNGTINDPNLASANLYDVNEVEYTNQYHPDKRIEIITLEKVDKRQQWKIVLHENKKFFRLKNVIKNTYLYIGQEPREGLVEFSTVDMDNNNYVNDPAFQNLAPNELENKTYFSFISSFGTQLNIIDESGE